MTKLKTNVFFLVIAVVLFTLAIARLALPQESCPWVNAVNYAGLFIAVVSLFLNAAHKYRQNPKFHGIAGLFVILIAILAVIGVLIIINILTPSARANDSITLFTLCISLPAPLYVELIGCYLKR